MTSEEVKLLLNDKRIDVNKVNKFGNTPCIMFAKLITFFFFSFSKFTFLTRNPEAKIRNQ